MVSRGRLIDVTELGGFFAVSDGEIVGILTYDIQEGACEVVTIDAVKPRLGVGRLLLEHMAALATSKGWSRLWLITTNDNVPAQNFYKECGWTLVAVHEDALKESRRLKPEIPLTGIDNVPIKDEWEYEWQL